MLRIALASPPVSGSVDTAMPWVERFIAEAADGEADIVCFPECYIPGLRGQDFAVEAHDPARLAAARDSLRYQEAATALISPEGMCLDHLAYGRPGLLIADIDPGAASRIYARRLAPETYR